MGQLAGLTTDRSHHRVQEEGQPAHHERERNDGQCGGGLFLASQQRLMALRERGGRLLGRPQLGHFGGIREGGTDRGRVVRGGQRQRVDCPQGCGGLILLGAHFTQSYGLSAATGARVGVLALRTLACRCAFLEGASKGTRRPKSRRPLAVIEDGGQLKTIRAGAGRCRGRRGQRTGGRLAAGRFLVNFGNLVQGGVLKSKMMVKSIGQKVSLYTVMSVHLWYEINANRSLSLPNTAPS